MTGDVAHHLTAARRLSDVDGVVEVEVSGQLDNVIGVVVHARLASSTAAYAAVQEAEYAVIDATLAQMEYDDLAAKQPN